MTLIVVRQAAIVANVEVVLNTREEEVAGIVNRLREGIRHADVGPARSSLIQRDNEAVVRRITRTLETRDVPPIRIRSTQIRNAGGSRNRGHVHVSRKYD